jgi:hypothetical protein
MELLLRRDAETTAGSWYKEKAAKMYAWTQRAGFVLLRYRQKKSKKTKTYNSGHSLVVTHLTTNPLVRCLNRAERTGSLIVSWSLTTKVLNSTVSSSADVETRQ